MTNAQALSARLARGEQLIGPGVFDALSAKICQEAGFSMAFLSGYALAAVRLGEPDFGLLTLSEVCEAARTIVAAVEIPLVVDADTGYGNPINVTRTVREIESTGAAGLLLEDQVWPKRCGHMLGKDVIPAEEYVQKLRAALDTRRDPGFTIIARTDARGPLGLDEAIRRALVYKEEGADVVFVEAPQSVEELRCIGEAVPGPQVANMIERGMTPTLPNDDLLRLGFQIVAYPVTGLYAAAFALRRAYTHLRMTGNTRALEGEMISFQDFHELIGLQRRMQQEQRYRAE